MLSRFLNLAGIGLLMLIGRLPGRRKIGTLLGLLGLRIARRRAFIAEVNLRLTQPELSPAQRRRLLRRHFIALGHWIMDIFWSLSATRGEICRYVKVEGNIPESCIILVPHFTGLEIGLLRLTQHLQKPLAYHYKPFHNSFVDAMVGYLRRRFGNIGFSTRSKYSLLAAVRHCRRGGVLCYLPDIDTRGRKSTIYVPFMAVEKTATTVGMLRLAKAANVPTVLCIVSRTENGYTIKIMPPIQNFPSGDDYADACLINSSIGEWVRKMPENYFWLHRRFKTNEQGETDVYN